MSSQSINVEQLQKEVLELQDIGFLLPEDTVKRIRTNFYQSETWAEVFWRRRQRHASREDPEIPFVFEHNPQTILEIGSAYGRVLRKLAEINQNRSLKAELTGIELCQHFKSYFQQYSQVYPSLQFCNMIYNDFFGTNALKDHSFDIILLPMNTFAGFPFGFIDTLFKKIKQYLSPKGLWIFSNYKLPQDKPLQWRKGYSGDLLVEIGQGSIALEIYNLEATETQYGMSAVTYMCYNKLTRQYKLKKREIFRTVNELIRPNFLKQLLEDNNFTIELFDDSSHSYVYGLASNSL
ncbi:MAG: hypothetical protein ACFFC7_03355 [Candidatus Hermodarchaeota archaeon]